MSWYIDDLQRQSEENLARENHEQQHNCKPELTSQEKDLEIENLSQRLINAKSKLRVTEQETQAKISKLTQEIIELKQLVKGNK